MLRVHVVNTCVMKIVIQYPWTVLSWPFTMDAHTYSVLKNHSVLIIYSTNFYLVMKVTSEMLCRNRIDILEYRKY